MRCALQRSIAGCVVIMLLLSGCASGFPQIESMTTTTTAETTSVPPIVLTTSPAIVLPEKTAPSAMIITREMAQTFHDATLDVEESVLPPIRISLCSVGDIMSHDGTFASARTNTGYDFTTMFAGVAAYTKDADYTIGNLETTFAGAKRGYAGYPCFNTPEQMADGLSDVLGMDLVSTANNHSMDTGFAGLCSTLDFLDAAGIDHTGTYRTEEESQQIKIVDINGAKVAFLSYTYGSNSGIGSGWRLNLINRTKIQEDAQAAYDAGADYIVALLHWGVEYQRTNSAQQRSLAEWIFANTEVQLIVGNHAHVVEPIEEITVERNGQEKKGIVFYALGNFTGAQRDPYRDTGIIVNLTISIDRADRAESVVEKIEYTPTFIDPNALATGKRYRVLAIEDAVAAYENGTDELITKEEYDKLLGYLKAYEEQLETLDIVSRR